MRIPVIPTIIVVTAVAIMVMLGFWQLGRADEKGALIARYSAALDEGAQVSWPLAPQDIEQSLYRRSSIACVAVLGMAARAGTNANGANGWAHEAACNVAGSAEPVLVQLGWSRNPEGPVWEGGEVTGWIAPGPRLVADPAQAELQPLVRPDPSDLPNNHLAYAWQWFLFALTALVIYILALRRTAR